MTVGPDRRTIRPQQEPPMNDTRKLTLRNLRDALSGEVEIRLPKAWLAIGAAGVAVLAILALD
jgi:hypothetical protein